VACIFSPSIEPSAMHRKSTPSDSGKRLCCPVEKPIQIAPELVCMIVQVGFVDIVPAQPMYKASIDRLGGPGYRQHHQEEPSMNAIECRVCIVPSAGSKEENLSVSQSEACMSIHMKPKRSPKSSAFIHFARGLLLNSTIEVKATKSCGTTGS
jgi:hypothetical protein